MTLTVDSIAENRNVLLAELNSRQAVVRDYVRSVALGYATGMYLFGRPGTAKTHTVRDVLECEIRQPYAYQRGHLTPVGLFDLLDDHPDGTVVLDDLGAVLRSDVTLQVLLAALEHPTGPDRGRVVRYRRYDGERRLTFRGGVICVSNRDLHDDELLDAFKSRVHVLNYDPTDAQLGALMLDLADRADRPAEAAEVARFAIGEMLRLGCRFDLRLFVHKALPLHQQWKDDETESDWRDLVTASIEEHLSAARHPDERPTRASRKAEDHAVLREILQKYPTRDARVKAWTERTGKSERAFYRRSAELR